MATFYHFAHIISPPFRLGMDDSGRPLYAFNVQLEKEVNSSVLWIDEIGAYLQTASVGTLGTDLYKFALTPAPDKQSAIVPYRGMDSEQQFGSDNLKWEYPRFQFISRGDVGDERPAAQTAHDAYIAIGKIQVETLS